VGRALVAARRPLGEPAGRVAPRAHPVRRRALPAGPPLRCRTSGPGPGRGEGGDAAAAPARPRPAPGRRGARPRRTPRPRRGAARRRRPRRRVRPSRRPVIGTTVGSAPLPARWRPEQHGDDAVPAAGAAGGAGVAVDEHGPTPLLADPRRGSPSMAPVDPGRTLGAGTDSSGSGAGVLPVPGFLAPVAGGRPSVGWRKPKRPALAAIQAYSGVPNRSTPPHRSTARPQPWSLVPGTAASSGFSPYRRTCPA
jgi:hypothetical protein